jgi:hypothetical protein
MDKPLDLILLIVGLICFLASAFGVPSKVNLMALGLACWILSLIV